MEEVKGHIHSIESFGTLDGPGIRYVLFLQGCPLRCLYCHNCDTWSAKAGKIVTTTEILEDILRYRSFIASGGITLSGGEPLMQAKFCEELIKGCKEKGIHTAIDTSGLIPLPQTQDSIEVADLILLDIKALDDQLCKELTGHSNQWGLKTLSFCEEKKKPVWIRHVLLSGYTLKDDLLEHMASYLSGFSCVERIELLPFHKMGEFKWESLGYEYKLQDTPSTTQKQVEHAKDIFHKKGLPVL